MRRCIDSNFCLETSCTVRDLPLGYSVHNAFDQLPFNVIRSSLCRLNVAIRIEESDEELKF